MALLDWREAGERLAGVWIDPDSIPKSTRLPLHLGPEARERYSQAEQDRMGEQAATWLQLTRGLRNRTIPRVPVVLALSSEMGLTPKQVEAATTLPKAVIAKALRRTWDDLTCDQQKAGRQLAHQLLALSRTSISWREAQQRLGGKINPDTVPLSLRQRATVRAFTKGFANNGRPKGSVNACETCGLERSCEQCRERTANLRRVNLRNQRERTTPAAIVCAAFHRTKLSKNEIMLLFHVGPRELENYSSKAPSDFTEGQWAAAVEVAEGTEQRYREHPFPVVAKGKAGEVRVGRLTRNQTIEPPPGVVVLTKREYQVLCAWVRGKSTQWVAEHITTDHMNTILGIVQRKFGAGNLEELRALLEAYGVTRQKKLIAKEVRD